MPVLQVNDQRYTLKLGETRLGVGTGVDLDIGGNAEAPGVHAIVAMTANGQVAIRRASEQSVRVNGIALGAEPTPLIHGDKVEIGGQELLYSDDTKAGQTQFVSAGDMMRFAQKRTGPARPTAATGGRLISLVDGKEYPIGGSGISIGRDAASDVVVAQNEVSRHHAEIVPSEQGYLLRDLSTNGVYLNGERIQQEALLTRADVVRVGGEEFRFYADVPAAAPKPTPQSMQLNDSGFMPAMPALAKPPKAAAPAPEMAKAANPAPSVAPAAPQPVVTAPANAQPVPDARPVLATFEVVNEGVNKGKRYEIRVPLAHVGRGAHNDIVVIDDSVSDTHSKLMLREDGWYVADVGSTNGTYVGGSRLVAERRLDGPTDVRFGGVKMMFRPQGAASPRTRAEVDGGAGGTRAIASLPRERASRAREVPSKPEPATVSERRGLSWIWILILAAAAVAAFLYLNG